MANWNEPKIDYKAEDQVTPSIFNTLGENEQYLKGIKITTEQVMDAVITFTAITARVNIASGDSIRTAFGKIQKWLADLGSLAFKSSVDSTDITEGAVTNEKIASVAASKVTDLAKVATSGSYTDLSDKPTIPSGVTVINNLTSTSTTAALSAYQGKLLNDRLNDLGFKTDNITDSAGNIVGTVKRQGSLVIGELTERTVFKNKPTYYIPSGFRPKQRAYIFLFTYLDAQIWGVIETSGNIGFGDSSGLSNSIANYGSSAPTTFGYEGE